MSSKSSSVAVDPVATGDSLKAVPTGGSIVLTSVCKTSDNNKNIDRKRERKAMLKLI